MTATFDTRLIAPKDVDGLLALWRETWIATYGIVLGAGTLANMLAELDQHGATGMLPGADERGYCIALRKEIIGSAIIAERGETAYLWGMYVRPDWQRRGAGSRLLLAGALGIQAAKRIEIRVLGSSPAAISFYRKHGFAEIDEELTEIFDKIEKPCLVMEVSVDTLKRLTVGS